MTFANGKFFTSQDMVQLEPDPFCKTLRYQLLFINNTAWQQMAHCPRHFLYSTVRGLRRIGDGSSIHLTFGTLVHAGAEIFSKARAAGCDAEEATVLALKHVLEESWPAGQETDVFGGTYGEVWQCSDRTRTNAKKGIKRCEWSYKEHLAAPIFGQDDIGPAACPVCGNVSQTRTAYLCTEKVKNRRTLARTVVALCDFLASSNVTTKELADGRVGSEYRWFRELDVPSPDDRGYMMTGSFDGVGEEPGGATLIPEYKSTQREPNAQFFAGYEMSPQVHTYTWAGQGEFGAGTRLMLYAIHVGTGFTEIYPKRVYLSPGSLAEWEGELGHKIQEFELRARLAVQYEGEGRNPADAYPRNLAGCNSLPGAPTTPCPFRDFCRLDPADRERFLGSNFEVAHYNPLEVHSAPSALSQEV